MGNKNHKGVLGIRITAVLLLLVVLFSQVSLAKEEEEKGSPTLSIVYFYENVCGSCDPEGEFIQFFNQALGEDKEGTDIEILMYNTFHDSSFELMEKYFEEYNVPEDRQMTPMLFIDGTFLVGNHEIEVRFKDEFLKAKEGLITSLFKSSTVLYFYATGCSSCIAVDKYLDTIQGINIHKYNIAEPQNVELIKKRFKVYDVSEDDQSVPVVFIGDTYLSGESAIKQHLTEKIANGEALNTPLPEQDEVVENELSGYGILGVLTTGFINGLNPCSISMLLFFLSMMVAKNINVLKIGFSFIAGKFITYFLLGTLLFSLFAIFNIPWFQTAVKLVLVVLVIIIALLNISDYFAVRKEEYDKLRMQLPIFLRKKNHQLIKKLTSMQYGKFLMPVSFGLGALISIGEFLCTGQIYLATIVSVLQNSEIFNFHAVIYFLIYGVAFVFPLLLLTIVIYKGREIFDVSEWVREKMPLVKLINALIFIIFGVIVWIWF